MSEGESIQSIACFGRVLAIRTLGFDLEAFVQRRASRIFLVRIVGVDQPRLLLFLRLEPADSIGP